MTAHNDMELRPGMSIANRTVLIIGTNRGIGRALNR